MTENVVLRKSDKDILRGEKDESDFQDFSTRQAQIRSRVRNRSKALVEEIQLLHEAGETEVVEQLLSSVCEESGVVVDAHLHTRIELIERELEELERRYDDVQSLRARLESIQEQLAD